MFKRHPFRATRERRCPWSELRAGTSADRRRSFPHPAVPADPPALSTGLALAERSHRGWALVSIPQLRMRGCPCSRDIVVREIRMSARSALETSIAAVPDMQSAGRETRGGGWLGPGALTTVQESCWQARVQILQHRCCAVGCRLGSKSRATHGQSQQAFTRRRASVLAGDWQAGPRSHQRRAKKRVLSGEASRRLLPPRQRLSKFHSFPSRVACCFGVSFPVSLFLYRVWNFPEVPLLAADSLSLRVTHRHSPLLLPCRLQHIGSHIDDTHARTHAPT